MLFPLHPFPRQGDDDPHRGRPLPGPQARAAEGGAGGLFRAARRSGLEEKAVHLRAARLAQAAAGRRHPAGGATQQREEGHHSAAARSAAQERAGCAPVRARGIHGARRALTPRCAVAFIEPVRLLGVHATLEPLASEHEDALGRAAADGALWRLWYTSVATHEKMGEYIATALDMREQLGAMPFVVRETASGEIIGCKRYFNVDATNRRLEIGHTW